MRMTNAILLAALLACTACVDLVGAGEKFVERDTRRFSTSSAPDLMLETFDGSIEVRAWDQPDVEVVIEKRAASKEAASTIEIESSQEGNQLRVAARVPKMNGFGIHFNYSRSAKLIVSAPKMSNLIARSGDGAIEVQRIGGRLDLRSGDGDIIGHDLAGEVKAHTGDGSIRLDGIRGPLDVDTGDGTVAVSGVLTAVRARTGDGGITIRADQGSAPTSDWEITTGDGAIRLELPDGFNAELDAHTSDGSIHMHDVELSNVSGEIGRNRVRGQLGTGGRLVRLRTGDGSITFRRALAAERSTP